MKKWSTQFKAIDAKTGQICTWHGETVEAPTWELAQEWCYNNRGYLFVVGELIAIIPCKEGSYDPDFDNKTDFENINNN